ncbi:phosphoceramide mannosyltransferase [Seminavis robusta]|uniref:Phosphoceramide mannosyltransferase n=1 Tax=Seminavis robusta TaxID=568900 RepID=A0A9N8HDB1_9STRA|nr:phosphoceramide mannosyltransferase [Seminavis robusta]|eukprot:Sro353_g124420.1 phosphoceramide mannosyltransferase (485) ;mRNA; f:9826-11280
MPSLLLDQAQLPLLESPSQRGWFFFQKNKTNDQDDEETTTKRKRKMSYEEPRDDGKDDCIDYFINDDRSHDSSSDSDSELWDISGKLANFRSRMKGRHSPTHSGDQSDVLPLIHQADSSSDLEDSYLSSPPSSNKSSSSSDSILLKIVCRICCFLPWAALALVLTYAFYSFVPFLLSLQYGFSHSAMYPNGLKPYTSVPNFHYHHDADSLPAPVYAKPVHIPRIVHVTYKSRDQLPAEWEYSLQQWEKTNPDWEIRFWSDQDLAEFVHTYYPEMEEFWKSYKYMIQRVDSVRYMILHHYGGLYSDMDIYPATSLDKLLQQWEDAGKDVLLAESLNCGVTNAFMAAAPQSEFMKCAVDNLPKFQYSWIQFSHWRHWEILSSAGSSYLWGMVGHCFSEGVEVMDKKSFRGCSVCDAWETGQPSETCDTEWLHHSSTNSSWHQDASFMHRLLVNLSYFFLCKPIRGCFLIAASVVALVRRRYYKKQQ